MIAMKRKVSVFLSWLAVVLCAVVIFCLSAQEATQSAELSGGFLQWLTNIFGEGLTDFIVRKCAHALEFCGLCLLLCTAMYATFSYVKAVYSFLITALYAVSDEVHQLFVQGRACRAFDFFVDCAGALAAVIFVLLIVLIVNKKFVRKDFI